MRGSYVHNIAFLLLLLLVGLIEGSPRRRARFYDRLAMDSSEEVGNKAKKPAPAPAPARNNFAPQNINQNIAPIHQNIAALPPAPQPSMKVIYFGCGFSKKKNVFAGLSGWSSGGSGESSGGSAPVSYQSQAVDAASKGIKQTF
jgi:hypothetical protein